MGRYRRPLGIAIILLMISYFVLPLMWQQGRAWVQRYRTGGMQVASGFVGSSLVYSVKPDQWLTFNFPVGTQQLRIISNAHIIKPDNITLEDNWKYILRYQLLAKDGKIIMDKLYHQRTRLTSYQDEHGQIFFGNFYSGHALTPLDGRLIMLAMTAIQQATSLRISFIQQSHEVEEMAIRLYIPAKVSEHRLADIWLRMSDKHKEMMAKYSVYPASLLSETEKSNLLKHQWQPLGPVGVEGKDYSPRTLYVLREVESEKLGELIVAAGLQLDAEHLGVIAIPEQGGELVLQLTGLDGLPLNSSADLHLKWFGRRREQRWQRSVQWTEGSDKLSFSVQGGLLQIKTSDQVLVHVVLKTLSQQHVEITAKPLMVTAYLTGQGVDYHVLHVNKYSTTIRVDIRRIYSQSVSENTTVVKYQWFNQQQQLIDSGILQVNSFPSIYDRLTGELKDLKVSDPVSYYLDIPAEVSQLRLISEQDDLMVSAYNQPYRYKKTLRVPESSYVSIDKKDWFPSWFMLRPENEHALLKHQAVAKVAAQYRLPEDDPVLLENQYLWEDFRPQGQAEARFILTEMTDMDYRDEALASVYCLLQTNQLHRIKLKTYGDLPIVSPELIYIRPQKSTFDVAVYIDRKLNINRPAIGLQGTFRLSGLTRGSHDIKVSTEGGGQWLMNYVSDCSSQAFLKRRVFKIQNRALSFIYTNNKAEDTLLSARFYTAEGNSERSNIQVSIEPLQKRVRQKIKQSWTFTNRRYDIRPAEGQSSIVLYSYGHFLNSGESFFIPFNSDMPKGQYRITMTLKKGAAGYLALSRLNPGIHVQRRFYRETNDQIN